MCVCVCVLAWATNLSICIVFRQGGYLRVCVCVCDLIVVKMLRLWETKMYRL